MISSTIPRCIHLLRCPISGQSLALLSAPRLAEINELLTQRLWGHSDSALSPPPLTQAVSTPDGEIVYRVDDNIVSLLPQLAIRSRTSPQVHVELPAEMQVVQSFYNEFGWVKTDSGRYNDSIAFSEPRACARRYQIRCNDRIVEHLRGGEYLLDVASGAIPHPEYLEHSRHYRTRICVDFSIRALREARARIGDHGLFILGDITHLPLAADSIDAVVSLHTLYHLPPNSQILACDELLRVARPHSPVLVVYVWSDSPFMHAIEFARRLPRDGRRLLHTLRGRPSAAPASAATAASIAPALYFRPCDYRWFATRIATRHPVRLRVWSAVTGEFQSRFFADHFIGRLLASFIVLLENTLPGWFGRVGQYPLWIFSKSRASQPPAPA